MTAILALAAASVLMIEPSRAVLRARADRKTQLAIGAAKEALMGFAAINGRLPRPALSLTNGVENPEPCASEAACTGIIPWLSLGISPLDSWGRLLRYSVTPVFTVGPIQASAAVPTKVVMQRQQNRLTYLAGVAPCTAGSSCVPAVIYSSGRDNFGISEYGVRMPNLSRSNVDEANNAFASVAFVAGPLNVDAPGEGGEFDDQVSYIAAPALYRRMKQARSLP